MFIPFLDILNNFTLNPETRSGQIGSSLQLQCLSPKSEPIANVYWEKGNIRLHGYENGSLILEREKILSSTIMIRNLTIQHVGTYRCVAYNALIPGKIIRSTTATVSIAGAELFFMLEIFLKTSYVEKRFISRY